MPTAFGMEILIEGVGFLLGLIAGCKPHDIYLIYP